MSINHHFDTLLAFLTGSFIITVLLIYLALKFLKYTIYRYFAGDIDEVRWQKVKPQIGGIAMTLTLILLLLAYLITEKYEHINRQGLAFFTGGVAVALLSGILDDIYGTKPILKITFQFIASLLCIYAINSTVDTGIIESIFGVFLIVACMNAFNMIDNMDGIFGTISTIISISMAVYFLFISPSVMNLLISLILIGSLAGFLLYNMPVSRIYAGDSGTQTIGMIIGYLATTILLEKFKLNNITEMIETLVCGGLMLYFPFMDMIIVSINRMRHGKPFYVGGIDHISHLLHNMGFSPIKIVINCAIFQFAGSLAFITSTSIMPQNIYLYLGFLILFGSISIYLLKMHNKNYIYLMKKSNNHTNK